MTIYEPDPSLPWVPRVLLRVEVGSTAHGTGTTEQEDYDELGVMANTWQWSIGIPGRPNRKETVVYRPGKEVGERSGPGDYDLTVHTARKFANLAAQGNPSVLMTLFGPLRYSHPNGLGDKLRSEPMVEAFWSAGARGKFLGYCRAQRARLEGIRGGKHTNRPELIEKYGYDTKYAMHMLRLGIQGREYMETGRITLPMPTDPRLFLQQVRAGNVTLETVLAYADWLEDELVNIPTGAPERPDYGRINSWLLDVFDWQRSGTEWKSCVPIPCDGWKPFEWGSEAVEEPVDVGGGEVVQEEA